MGRQIKTIYKKAESSFNNPEHKKKWQGGIGILVMVVFVLSSVLFNNTVQALNLAAGNYGYSSGTYGYNAGTSSDFLPKPPTALTTSSAATTSITLSWTAPTQTQGSTSLDNLHATTPYLVHYSTGSLSNFCSGGSSTTSTTTTVGLTGLTAGTTYNVNVCTKDANSNRSDDIGTAAGVLASTFTTGTASSSTGGGGTVTTIGSSPVTAPVVAIVPVLPGGIIPPVASIADTERARQIAEAMTKGLKVTLTFTQQGAVIDFIGRGGTTPITRELGPRGRGALIKEMVGLFGANVDIIAVSEDLASGKKPKFRNLQSEKKAVGAVSKAFEKFFGRKPNLKDAKDDFRYKTIMYPVRFHRDLAKEKAAIAQFKKAFKRNPKTSFDWRVVRAGAYVN